MQPYKKLELACGEAIAADYNGSYHSAPLQRLWDGEFVAMVRREVPPGALVLDLASGPGGIWPALADAKYRIVALDLSIHMLQEGRKAGGTAALVNADAEALPFPNESFDAVICSSALHHLEHAEPAVREIARVLKPYGTLVGREPNEGHTFAQGGWMSHAVMALVNSVQRRHRIEEPEEPDLHEHHRSLPMAEFFDTLSQHVVVHRFTTEFAFSSLFARIPKEWQARVIRRGDHLLRRRRGAQVYYAARKHGYGAGDVMTGIRAYIRELDEEKRRPYPKVFIVFLLFLTCVLDFTLPKR